MKSYLLSLFISLPLLAQWHASPFPTTAPTSGYRFEAAWPTLDWTGPNRPQGFEVHDGRVYVICRYGRVWVVSNPGSATPSRSLIINIPTFATGDSGFPGFVFHPSGTSLFTWTNESVTNNGVVSITDRIRRWPFNPANPTAALSLSSSTILMDQPDRSPEHSGGDMHFGQDGYLYISLGDEGGQGGILGNGQVITNNFFSGILRVDVDNRPDSIAPNPHPALVAGWKVPADNPWVGATSFNGQAVDPLKVRTEFYAVGLRNPTKFSIDTNGVIWSADVGGSRWESLRRITKGSNHGWNWYEGPEVALPYAPPVNQRPTVSFTEPAWAYPHSAIAASVGWTDQRFIGNCIIGGTIYRGAKYPSLNGKYIFGDYVSKNVWAVSVGQTNPVPEWLGSHPTGFSCAAVNPGNGDILVGSFGDGQVWKMVPSVPVGVPATLSSTGVFTNLITMAPDSGVLPYEVASPFWSDEAIKTRWFFLPPSGVIYRGSNDVWSFPSGAVWVKHFELPYIRGFQEGRKVETRFTVKTDSGLYGLTYRWREDGSDADLVPEEGDDSTYPVTVNGSLINQKWHWPSRSECSTCHNPESGHVLGFSARQLNTEALAGGAVVNQLLGLSELGAFSTPYTSISGVPRLSRPLDETATLEHRFKSYTDANCSYCHFPGGPGRGEWDARFSTPLALSHIVGGSVIEGYGIPGSAVVSPSSPSKSILYRRVADFVGDQEPAEYHMPPLATFQRNEAGISMIERFINSIPSRTNWVIGLDDNRSHDFKIENASNPPAPGSSTALDDDFYTAGTYPIGFNGLVSELVVPNDEPWVNWERALTRGNRVNRFHFVSGVSRQGTMKTEFYTVGSMIGGIVQPGYATHSLEIRHIATNSTNVLWQGTVTSPIVITVPVQIQAGPNTIEFYRPGPLAPSTSYWMTFDYVSVE